jgi:CHAD domain-containing protein
MGYRLRRGHAVGEEASRLYEEHLRAAARALSSVGQDLHAIRKLVKKANAVLFAGGDAVGPGYVDAKRELKTANRALGELADAYRIIETVDLLKGFAPMPDAAVAQLRAALARRAAALERKALLDQTRPRARRAIVSALARARHWPTAAIDDQLLASSIRRAHARARQLRREAARRPAIETYHEWRQRVKREWYLVRLIADQTGDRLKDDQHRLAALVACLGRLHDAGVLTMVVATEPILPRRQRTRALLALRALIRDLRRQSKILAVALDDRPAVVERRVLALWGMRKRSRPIAEAA